MSAPPRTAWSSTGVSRWTQKTARLAVPETSPSPHRIKNPLLSGGIADVPIDALADGSGEFAVQQARDCSDVQTYAEAQAIVGSSRSSSKVLRREDAGGTGEFLSGQLGPSSTEAVTLRRDATYPAPTPAVFPPPPSSLVPGPTNTRRSRASTRSPSPLVPTEPVEKNMTTNIEIYNALKKKLDKELDARSEASRSLLHRYLREMKKTHAYIVRSSLAAARLDLNAQSAYDGTPGSGSLSVSYDSQSPFADMPGIDTTVAEAKERGLDVGKFNVRYHNKPHAPSEYRLVVSAMVAETPKTLEKVPKYHSYTTLRNNILSDDDDVMRYYPYLGEDAGDDDINQLHLEETFVDRTRASAEEGKKNECAAMYTTFINDYLRELGLNVAAITNYLIGDISRIHHGANQNRNETIRRESLPDDFDLEDAKLKYLRESLGSVNVKDLEKAEPVCRVFKQQTKVSIWEVVKRANQMVKDSISPARLSTGTSGTSRKDEREAERGGEVAMLTGGNPQPYSLESYAALNCLLCFMHECRFHVNKDHDRLAMTAAEDVNDTKQVKKGDAVILNLATNVPGWACMSKGSMIDPWGKQEECSAGCFINEQIVGTTNPGDWSPAQDALLKSSAAVLRNNPRCSCLIASIINKPCAEIYRMLVLEELLPEPAAPAPPVGSTKDPEPKQGVKRKKFPVSALPGYPSDCDRTHTHERRTAFQACRHLGHCTSSCPCGAVEALEPKNRYGGMLLSVCCQNVALQRDMPRRTLLGRSSVAGFGLFMGEDVKKDSFLGEYKGEVITSEEAERRGKLYDKRGVSFLFNLNSNQVIDATRAGNKFRYVNHSTKRPNCFAKVFMANCTHRIGMFARRDLAAGEELFFDYGYNNKQVKFVHKEPPEIPGLGAAAGEKSGRSRKPNKGTKVMSRKLDYLKGGRGTTERSRAIKHNSGLSYSVNTTAGINSGSFTPAIASVPAGGAIANTSSRNTTTLIVPGTAPSKEGQESLSQAARSSLSVEDSDADEVTDAPSASGKSPFAYSSDSLSGQSSESDADADTDADTDDDTDDDADDEDLTDDEEEYDDDEPPRRIRRSRSRAVVQRKRLRRG